MTARQTLDLFVEAWDAPGVLEGDSLFVQAWRKRMIQLIPKGDLDLTDAADTLAFASRDLGIRAGILLGLAAGRCQAPTAADAAQALLDAAAWQDDNTPALWPAEGGCWTA